MATFEALYRQHVQAVFRFALSVAGQREVAEDLTSEAFLALHRRTGDPRWLERARLFAVHALEQVERDRERYGVGRHSLWTGDIGVAVTARSCIEARPGMPTLDWV